MTTDNTENNEVKNEETENQETENKETTEAELLEQITAKQQAANQAIARGETELESLDEEEQGTEIDQNLVDAGRAVGMTDDEIIDMATDNPKALEAIAVATAKSDNSDASESNEDETDDTTENNTDKEDGETSEEIDLESLDPEVAKVVGPLLKKIKGLEEKVTKTNEVDEQKKAEEIQAAINQDFDDLNEAFPVLGASDTMTQAQFALRQSVLDEALAINALPSSQKSGLTWPEAMQKAATNVLGEPKAVSKEKSKNKSVKPDKVKKLFTQKPSGRKETIKKGEEMTEAQLAENIATIQNSVRQ